MKRLSLRVRGGLCSSAAGKPNSRIGEKARQGRPPGGAGVSATKKHLPFLLFVISFLIFSAACGGKKTTRITLPAPPPAAKQAPPEKPRAAEQPGIKPPVQQRPPQAIVIEPPDPAIDEKAVPSAEFEPGPLIRIGLDTTVKEIRISSTAEYYLTEKVAEAEPRLIKGEIQIRVEREGAAQSVYRVQIASYTKKDLADELKDKIETRFDEPVIVHDNRELGLKQVRVGELLTKADAQSLRKQLVEAGYQDAFVVQETSSSTGGKTTLAVRGVDNLLLISSAGFLFRPSSRSVYLQYNGKPYRGNFDITLNKSGCITVVNQLGMEEYLLGVVPAEMSPVTYPEFEALAAQSIAARTYALRNMGRYRSEGFDLGDDTRTQVYKGVSVEHKLTSEAVRTTAGLAVYHEGKPIDAMFMSTCGGRTEDFSNVFDTAPVPYLKSVFCSIESGPAKGERILAGKHDLEEIIVSDDGSIANRNLELARILGIVKPDVVLTSEWLIQPIRKSEALQWVENARTIARIRQQGPEAGDITTRAGFYRYAAESFFAGEIKAKISNRDTEYYIGNLKDGDTVPEAARMAVTYLMRDGKWRPFADNTIRAGESMRRGDALSLLLRWVESARPDMLRKGIFVAAEADADTAIQIKSGSRTQAFKLSSNPYLFRIDSGRTTPVSSLRIIGNEKIYFHVTPDGSIDYIEMELNPTGASSDRYSPVASWDVTLSRSVIAEKLRSLTGDIGEFRDLKPARLGNSGRAVQIQVTGSRNSVILNGYKVRNALGLKDTLFTLTREYNSDGSIGSFTFHGHGWGHGVGLCQVGAFGMARAGKSYEAILKTYYQDVQIRKAY